MNTAPTRGERNNNPLNLNFIAYKPWKGQIGREIVPPGMKFTARFGRYDTVHNGIRAGACQIVKNNVQRGLSSLYDLIADIHYGWSPTIDGNYPLEYAEFVQTFNHVADIHAPFDLRHIELLVPTVTGFITEENGRCLYTADLITSACRDALGLPEGATP